MSILHTGWTPSLSDEELKRNEYKAVLDNLIADPENEYWKNRFKELVEEAQLADADKVHDLLHPVEEAYQAEKQYECEMCREGVSIEYCNDCECCNGNWTDCDNCKPEGTGNDTADLLAGMRG